MSTQSIPSAIGKKSFVSDLTASGIFGILNTSFMVSYATLIFAKPCPEYFGTYVALLLLAASGISIMLALFSTYSGTIGSVQDVPAAISAVIAVSFAQLLVSESADVMFANIFTTIALSTILTGVCFLLLGYFKLGNLVRFIPYPVLGGFLAATGWLLFIGGIQVTTGVAFKLVSLPSFFSQVPVLPLVLGLVFSITLIVLTGRFPKNMLITPAVIISSILAFLFVSMSLGYPIDQLKSEGWLLGPLPDGALWRAAAIPDFSLVNWPLVFKQIGSILTIVVLSAISFLLNSSGIEIIAGRDLDMNKDLKATGITNAISSVVGAPASYVLVSQTALATRIGATSRNVGVLHGIFLLAVFFIGGTFLSFFPKFVAGGLLLYLGISMLKEWVVDSLKSIPKVDYCIIVGIVLIVEFFGFLEGVAIGIVASVVIFVFRYSTINLIKNILDGSNVRSSKDRSITDQRLLDYNSNSMAILQLQGFIFFGTANSLYENVKRLVTSAEKPIKFIVMDLGLVQGIDSSAVRSFEKLSQYLEKEGIDLVLVNLSERLRTPFDAVGFTGSQYDHIHEYDALDRAVEYCEDHIIKVEAEQIQQAKQEGIEAKTDLMQAVYSDMMAALDIQISFENLTDRMKPYLEKINAAEGMLLFTQKELAQNIYFIIRGTVTLSREDRDGQSTRIRMLGPWTITGELGAFLGYRSPYTAVVNKKGVIYKLSEEDRKRMINDNPDLASEFQQLVIIMLGNQLMKTSRVIGSNTH